MAPYRLLHLISSSERRGAQLFAMRLAKRLESERFENHLCALYGPRPSSNGVIAAGGIDLLTLGGPPGFLERGVRFSPSRIWALRNALRCLQPRVVVAHGSATLKYCSIAKLLSHSLITVYINIGIASFWADSPLKVRSNGAFLRGVDVVVSVSQRGREDLLQSYGLPTERVTFIPNGVEVSDFDSSHLGAARAKVRAELGLHDEASVLVTVGNLSAEKGQADLLSVLAALHTSGLSADLLLVGDGPLREELSRRARHLGIADRVRFLGSRSDVPQVLAAADLFVLSSRTEGMPAVLIEAALAGLPSVSYNVGGVGEVIEDGVTGVLVPHGDRGRMTQSVETLLRDSELRLGMGRAALRRCQELFNMNVVVQEYESLLLRMLNSRVEIGNGHT